MRHYFRSISASIQEIHQSEQSLDFHCWPDPGRGKKTVALKWLALKLDGPGANPFLKDFRALLTSMSAP